MTTATIKIALDDIVFCDYEQFLDTISTRAFGSDLATDISYIIVGYEGNTLMLEVTADTSVIDQ